MILQSHPTGNNYVRQSALTLCEAGLMAEFWTCVNWNPDSPMARWLPAKLQKQFARRTFDPAIAQRAHTHPWREIGRLFSPALGLGVLTKHETGVFSVDAVFGSLDRKVAGRLAKLPGLRGVYAGEDGALHTFRTAKKQGLNCFYDLPIAYWQTKTRLLEEEVERWPEWEPTLVGTRDSSAKMARKTEELVLADVVFVPSQFVLDSLPSELVVGKPCYVVPFGSPDVSLYRTSENETNGAPLRVLFAGSMTQRKGLADVFAAMQLLKRRDVELVVMGSPISPMEFYRRQFADFRYETPRPHREVLALMQSCDVLVLPSIAEGRALVQQEALACGLPLIVTPNAGGEDLIEDGRTGFLVPIRSPEVIAEKIEWFAEHRSELPEMRSAARIKALEYTWEAYGQQIALSISSVIVPCHE